jgi:cell division protein ZapA (FtsZ GTPase activity inhibitor)
MTNEIRLDILGTSFSITADEDEEYLNKVLTQYREAVKSTQSISGIKEPLNVAILTGFILCDEFNKVKQRLDYELEAKGAAKDEDSWEDQEVEDRTLRLITKLEQALNLFSDDKHLQT